MYDTVLRRSAELGEGEVVTFGTAECADVEVCCGGVPFIAGQCVADGAFLFCRHRNLTTVMVMQAEMYMGERRFLVRSDVDPWQDLSNRQFSEETVFESFEGETLQTVLAAFRRQGAAPLMRGLVYAVADGTQPHAKPLGFEDSLINAIAALDALFWVKHELTDDSARRAYLGCLWAVWAAVFSLGPLTSLARDERVTEILVKHFQEIYVEREGVLEKTRLRFHSCDELLALIERMAAGCGRRIDESQPFCDARLADGSRMHAIIAPAAIDGPCLTIRRFRTCAFSGEELVERGSLDSRALEFLKVAVRERKNILIAGGTGSGKTTLLNVLSGYISGEERIVTIEDSAELRLNHPHVVRLEGRAPNTENRGEITLRTLVRNALRMRPDRIVIGECRGPEAFDMLQAMNTGHAGSMTTIHANSASDALRRLELLILLSADNLELAAVREQIGACVEVVVHIVRERGVRKVSQISRVRGVSACRNGYSLEAIF